MKLIGMTPVVAFLLVTCVTLRSIAFLSQSECQDIDYSERMGPVRNQGSTNTCFAMVAADLVTVAQGLSVNDRVSALDMSYAIATADPVKIRDIPKTAKTFEQFILLQGRLGQLERLVDERKKLDPFAAINFGFVRNSILAYATVGGYCTENQLPSEGTVVSKDASKFLGRQVLKLMEIGKSQIDAPDSWDDATYVSFQNSTAQNNIEFAADEKFSEIYGVRGMKALEVVKANIEKACLPRRPLKPMQTDVIGSNRMRYPPSVYLSYYLMYGLPVGVGIDSKVLKQGSEAIAQSNNHKAIIAGTRWNRGTCEFKLRNSWGMSCSHYGPGFKENCDGGNIWMSEEEINRNIFDIEVIVGMN